MKRITDLTLSEWEQLVHDMYREIIKENLSDNEAVRRMAEKGFDIPLAHVIGITECPDIFTMVDTARYIYETATQ